MRQLLIGFFILLNTTKFRIFAGTSTVGSPLNRENIKDSEGQSLAEKMRLASRAYLELNLAEAERQVQNALDLILKSPPYPGLKGDLSHLASLVIVIEEESPKEVTLLDAFPFRHEIEFQRNISERLKDKWLEETRALVKVERFEGLSETYLSGERLKLPTEIPAGRYLVHTVKADRTKSGWLKVSESKSPDLTEVYEVKNLQLNSNLIAENRETKSTKVAPNSAATQTNLWLQAQANPKMIDPTNLDMRMDSPSIGEDPFYKKTWFWVVLGLAAGGLGGYAAYQANQSPTVIRTP